MKTNLTISAEAEDVRKARDVARKQGTTLNEMLRRYLQMLAGGSDGADAAGELLALFKKHRGNSGGKRPRRDDAYEGRA